MRAKTFQVIGSLFTVALLGVAVSSSLSAAEQDATTEPSDYRIGIEDVLDITVWNQPELHRVVPVRPDGKISLPLVNDIVAAGLTPMELRRALTEKLADFVQAPDVSVVVSEIHSFKVSVLGSVRKPGRYELKGPSTALDALALAEGFTEFAARRKITILRQNGSGLERLRFDYFAAVSEGNGANLLVKPGDIILVP